MGREHVSLSVTATVSRHNDERDDEDDAAWDLFRAEVQKLADREEFKDIGLLVF